MRARTSIAASPTVVGAITTLITAVAVFLAYNANNGLPFVPTYKVSLEIPNAARVLTNNEVRIGGARVGTVESITVGSTEEADDGTVAPATAVLNLKLNEEVAPLPQDSTFRVRYRSAFGLKYLEIRRGDGPPAPEGFLFDGTDDGSITSVSEVPAGESSENGAFIEQTEFDDIYNTFDAPTREAIRTNLMGFGDALAARGESLNEAIASLALLLEDLEPVADLLAADETQLRRFVAELADFAEILAPVALDQAELFTRAARTFELLSTDVEALQEAISEGPETLEVGIRTLPGQTEFLADFAELSRLLRPGASDLSASLPVLNSALVAGTPVLGRSPQLTDELEPTLAELNRLVERPSVPVSLMRLEGAVDSTVPALEHIVPMQTVCNYWTYFWTFVPNAVSERDQIGTNLRNNIIQYPLGPMGIGTGLPAPFDTVTLPGMVETGLQGYSGIQANGIAGEASSSPGTFEPFDLPVLYVPGYGPAGQQDADCQAGQVGYLLGRLPSFSQPAFSPVIARSDLPGSRGPTTLFLDEVGNKSLRDTRVDSRQPETWR